MRDYFRQRYKVDVGMYSYGGCFNDSFNVGGEVVIGRYCSIADKVNYFGANHPLENAIMSPWFYNKSFSGFNVKDVPRSKLTIGHDVWIGYGVIITNGCKRIGNGAVIGAGSIVTHDVPPYAIVVGNPSKVIKYRFPSNIIEEIEKSKWWELSPEELMKYYEYMSDPEIFSRKVYQDRFCK